jgi:hypothetical protein
MQGNLEAAKNKEIIVKIIFLRVFVLVIILFGMKGFIPVLGSSNFVNFSI